MSGASDRSTLVVGASDETIHTWINRPYVSSELHDQLAEANVLLVPTERYEEGSRVHFPAGTEEFFQFLQASEQQGLSVDICISDEDYQELALYADWLVIADLVVGSVAAPIVVNLIWHYIKQRLGSRTETQVKSKLTVQNTGSERSILFEYEGPASEYHKVMMEALRQNPKAPQELDPNHATLAENTEVKE